VDREILAHADAGVARKRVFAVERDRVEAGGAVERDGGVLADAGFRLERVLPVDQFIWSPHVEVVGAFVR